MTGALSIGTAFTGLETILLVTPFAARPHSLRKGLQQAVIFVGVFMIFVTVITIAKFGPLDITHQLWPTLEMMDIIDLPGSFIERQDALIMSFWIISNFAILNSGLFFSSVLLKDVVGKGKHSLYIIICMPIILLAAVALLDVGETERIIDYIYYTLGVGFMVLLPIILLVAARFRKAA
jgi:spore germination protein